MASVLGSGLVTAMQSGAGDMMDTVLAVVVEALPFWLGIVGVLCAVALIQSMMRASIRQDYEL